MPAVLAILEPTARLVLGIDVQNKFQWLARTSIRTRILNQTTEVSLSSFTTRSRLGMHNANQEGIFSSAIRSIRDVVARVAQDATHQHPQWLYHYQTISFNDTSENAHQPT